jgi:hypothetical protein
MERKLVLIYAMKVDKKRVFNASVAQIFIVVLVLRELKMFLHTMVKIVQRTHMSPWSRNFYHKKL